MKTALCVALLAWLTATPAQAGCCFLWTDDGSRSTCKESVPTRQACESLRRQGKWDRCYLIEPAKGERCACEGPDGKGKGDLSLLYYPDRNDLDDDDNREETVRRRYVVSIGGAEIADGTCRERHHLHTGWTDSGYS